MARYKIGITLAPPAQCAHKAVPFLEEHSKTARLAPYFETLPIMPMMSFARAA